MRPALTRSPPVPHSSVERPPFSVPSVPMRPPTLTAFLIALCLIGQPVFAQSTDEAPENARVRLGALRMRPTVSLTNLGIDNNVFNESDLSRPKSDVTMTVTPAADLWMRIGRSTLSGSIREDLVYYQTYA